MTLILKPPLPSNGVQLVVLTLKLGPGFFCVLDSPPQHRRGGQIGCYRVLHLCDEDLHLVLEAPQGIPALVKEILQEYEGVAFLGSGHVVGEGSLRSIT